MKRIFALAICMMCLLITTSCNGKLNISLPEEPVVTYETVEAKITNLDIRHWYAQVHRYEYKFTLYIEKYDMTRKITESASGMFLPKWADFKEGDTVKVRIYTQTMRSTGEVVGRGVIGWD